MIRANDPYDTTAGSTGTTWAYAYDQGGNILSKTAYAFTTGTVGTVVKTDTYTYGDSNWKDKLTAFNGTAISYDAIGNPTSDGTWTYTWEKGRQLKRMAKSGETATFTYNADGLRVKKVCTTTGTTSYTLHGKNVVHLSNGSNNLHFFYDAQNRPAVVVFNGVAYGYVHNQQGDIVAIVNSAGTKVVEYAYDAWGKPLSKTGSMASTLGTLNPFRYRSYFYDEETELYYLRSRYYHCTFNRFICADVLYKENVFYYCQNNPIRSVDDDGYASVCCFDENGFMTTFAALSQGVGGGGGGTSSTLAAYANPDHDRMLDNLFSSVIALASTGVGTTVSIGAGKLAKAFYAQALTEKAGKGVAYGIQFVALLAGDMISETTQNYFNHLVFGRELEEYDIKPAIIETLASMIIPVETSTFEEYLIPCIEYLFEKENEVKRDFSPKPLN